ncbi:SiaB family protein kinase [Cesiribacter andamanensis]|nr:SiaB family protein kinase [Cesiribacter andamanensis]
MLVYKVYELYQALEDDGLSLFYLGDVSDNITEKLIALNDRRITEQPGSGRSGRKIAFLIAECFQNVIRHQEQPSLKKGEKKPDSSMFMVRHHRQSQYSIASVNLVRNQRVAPLQAKLGNLSRLDGVELRKMYLDLLPGGEYSDKGGAGLGLIEMARRSGQQFQYDFVSRTDAFSQFFFQLHMQEEGAGSAQVLPISSTQKLYESLQQEGILLLYKSDFSQKAMMPVLEMIEFNLRQQRSELFRQKAILYVLVELFQNIMKHGAEWHGRQEGVLCICKQDDHHLLCAGNFIAQDKIPQLRQHLLQINALDKGGLQQLYKQELRNTNATLKGGAGLGLIETGRYSTGSFDFSFVTVNDHYSFFTLSTTI